ncbi:MAG: putative cytosolic protein [Myxococcaceae bacterium]|nr:putative cytosolic protein [Myxococcaceae bacterium]
MATVEPSEDVTTQRKSRIEAFPRIVTVAREFGAGGSRISLRVAAELGYQLWDQELTAYLARKVDAEPAALREVDERERPLFDEVIATSLYGRISCSKFRTLLTRTVGELAERGGAVIVGRGANFLVEPDQALRVRIVCPLKRRIDRYAKAAGCDWSVAERYVLAKDRERERFAKQLCGEQTCDPTHYDVTINTHELSEEASARLVIAAHRARFGATKGVARDEVGNTPFVL